MPVAVAKKKKSKGKAAARRPKAVSPVLNQTARPARPLFRLLPLTILTAFCLFALKVVEIIETGRSLGDSLVVGTVEASQDKAAAPATVDNKQAEKASSSQAAAAPDAKADSQEKGPVDVSATPPVPTSPGRGMDVPNEQLYNKRELGVLENLANRREKIEQLERDLDLREKVLKATEQRIDEKLAELSRLNTEVKDMLVVHSREEETKMSSLVKIYEAMKPKEAARIFDEMDMDILLMVVGRMNERRLAPVLAAMTPDRAKDVTQRLADQQRVHKQTLEVSEQQVNSPPL